MQHLTDDQWKAALLEEMERCARIVTWRRGKRFETGVDRPDALTIAVTARMGTINRMLNALDRADALDSDSPF